MHASLAMKVCMGVATVALIVPATMASQSASAETSAAAGISSQLQQAAGNIPTPDSYFGFHLGSDGNLATWDKMVPYFKLVADKSPRVNYEKVGDTTQGNPYVMLTISSPKNLKNLDRLVEINRRLADSRGLSQTEAQSLAREGKPFYYIQAGIHATEVGNSQAMLEVAHRLATDTSPTIRKILDNAVILLVPSQNPDGLVMVNDYFKKTAGTNFARTYPDLYQKYTGHDDNRDWFMLTQAESRLMVSIQNKYHPQLFQDAHQAGQTGVRMFTPPYLAPHDTNIDPITVQQTNLVGMAMQRGMTAAGLKGGGWGSTYDYWSPSRQYQVYHGTARLLTEAASAQDLAYPFTSNGPIGPQQISTNFLEPYEKSTWTLRDIMDYTSQTFYSGVEALANDPYTYLYNTYQISHKAVTNTSSYAYVIAANQRDPQAVRDTIDILHTGAVEVHQAKAPFTAGGKSYPTGSYVVYTKQPYFGFAKTLLEAQDYPSLAQYPGGPPQRPYDVTAQTLPMLLGFQADLVKTPFTVNARLLTQVSPQRVSMPAAPADHGAYVVGPESYGVYQIVSALQKAGVPTFRAAAEFTDNGSTYAAGTLVIPPSDQARTVLQRQSKATGIAVSTIAEAPRVEGVQLRPNTRIGLIKPPNNMPAGWLMWMFDQYKVNYKIVKANDYKNLGQKFDALVMPSGVTKDNIVKGLDSTKYPKEWKWAYGVGEDGWKALHDFVADGGTLVANGKSTGTAQALFDLPLKSVLPTDPSTFYAPGSLLAQEFDTNNPVAWGISKDNPVWFQNDAAYQITDTSKYAPQVVSKYPATDEQLRSGWLIGGEYLKGAVNDVAWTVGKGTVVTFGNQSAFRTWNRAEQKMIFNSMYNGPSTKLGPDEFANILN